MITTWAYLTRVVVSLVDINRKGCLQNCERSYYNIPHHHTLKDGGERGDSNACTNHDGMLCLKDVSRGSAIGTVYVNLNKQVHEDWF